MALRQHRPRQKKLTYFVQGAPDGSLQLSNKKRQSPPVGSTQPSIVNDTGAENHPNQQTQPMRFLTPRKRIRPLLDSYQDVTSSRFQSCPLCQVSFPLHVLPTHAADCTGEQPPKQVSPCSDSTPSGNIRMVVDWIPPTRQIMPGLYQFENFITQEEEQELLDMLDDVDPNQPTWELSRFNGQHNGKRWGVKSSLSRKTVVESTQVLPAALQEIVLRKLSRLQCLVDLSFAPNEANAIDYRKSQGDWLHDHVDDRKLSKEPIVNLSLAGNCTMRFRRVARRASHTPAYRDEYRAYLPRRSIQVLTGPARYDYSHGIAHVDLESDRRVSITIRESPLTHGGVGPNTKPIVKYFGKSTENNATLIHNDNDREVHE
eukprot:Nitzschia sp. Nitz4//scaffold231_size31564//1269//2387//NITZ4_007936-RA/size31564-processed-gene-0.44-mRNA-1//-1//CDS//3329543281//598//frame0